MVLVSEAFSILYGTTLLRVERQNREEWCREAGLSAPRKDAVSVIVTAHNRLWAAFDDIG